MPDHLRRAFTLRNLRKAWLWTRTGSNIVFKNYFRHIYRSYSLCSDECLRDLRTRLINNTFRPNYAIKVYFPKKTGILRPYSLLCIEDQIAFQALVNIIAEKLYPRVRRRYYKTVFGHLCAGKRSQFFYRYWSHGYAALVDRLRSSFRQGYVYTASFDLTACYDSIDHSVLKYCIRRLGLEPEFANRLCEFLRVWTASSSTDPIYQGHGIPQGPLPSGLLSECVLMHFDVKNAWTRDVRYFRYVDDIRLLARSKKSLQRRLIQLDLQSKEIGLFPQASKTGVRRVKNIGTVIKTISYPPELLTRPVDPDQASVRSRLQALSPRYKVRNETRFKYILATALPSAGLARRLLRILRNSPHLFTPVLSCIARTTLLPGKVSEHCMRFLRSENLYDSLTAGFIRVLKTRLSKSALPAFITFCKKTRLKAHSPELRQAVMSTLIYHKALTLRETRKALETPEWWVRSCLVEDLKSAAHRRSSFTDLVNRLLKDGVNDVALAASDLAIAENVTITSPRRGIRRIAQFSLRAAGLLGRISRDTCPVSEIMVESLGANLQAISWRTLLGQHYQSVSQSIVQWKGYAEADPTAWTHLTDTINDRILDSLYLHDPPLGRYQLGQIGSVLHAGSRFARKYPSLFRALDAVHNLRLESYLSHPIVRKTGTATRKITHTEMENLFPLLAPGYRELWNLW